MISQIKPPFRKLRGYAFDPSLSLKIDTADFGHFLSCITNSLHEDKEIVIILKESEISSGLYLMGNPIFPTDEDDELITFREKIRYIKVPKKLYHME